MKYLIVNCEPLSDGWECDADRTPVCITNDLNRYWGVWGYEIYKIQPDGQLTLIQNYE